MKIERKYSFNLPFKILCFYWITVFKVKKVIVSDLILLSMKVARSMQMTHFFSSLWLIFRWARTCAHTHMHVYTHTHHIFSIHSFVEGYLGCLHILAFVRSAAMNIGMHVSFRILVFSRYVPRSGTAGSHGISVFNFLRNLHAVLHSEYIDLHSHQQCREVPLSPQLQHLLCIFDGGHLDWYEVVPHGSFLLRFSNN